MSKPSKQKNMDRAGVGGREGGEASSGARKQRPPLDGDHETALKLQEMLDEEAGYSDHRRRPQKETPADSRRLDKAEPYPKEIQDALHEVQKFVVEVMETTCRKCDSTLMRDFDVHRWFKQWTSTQGQPQPSSICSLTCPKKECQALTCLGCGEKPRMGKFTGKIGGFHLDWCCESGRLFALWSFLCEFDNLELAEQERSRRQVEQSSRHRTNESPSTNKQGIGYDSGPDWRRFLFKPVARVTETLQFKQAESKTDASTKEMLALIIELLPRRSDKSKSVPPALGAMIELSLIQDRIAELLRNDSLQDATTRAGLYYAVFEFFERLGKHPDTLYLVHEERFVKMQSSGLFAISTSKYLKGKGKAQANHYLTLGRGEDSTTASLLACMSNIGIQSESLLKASRAVKSEFRTTDGQDLLEIADRIAKLELSMKPQNVVHRQKDGSGSKSDKDMTWKEYNLKHCMRREENVLHYLVEILAVKARNLRHSPPNRIKRLVIEASEMETSLPPNIFVKVDEARPDVMKCLIGGPEGTPYEGGLFEFDIFCPLDYPQSPPLVIFRNTGGGKILFNPNLHPDGKVCLSLLGTWDGPPESKWQGAKSTILSVLISIQAMIFCSNPIENEPFGYKGLVLNRVNLRDSHSYTSLVQAWTVRYAMLDWLKNNEMRTGLLWRNVVRTYFERNGEAVLGLVNRWKGANKHIGSFDGGKGIPPNKPCKLRDLERELANALQALKQDRR